MGLIEDFWGWLFGQGSSEFGKDNDGGDLKKVKAGNFVKHRTYMFVGAYQEMDQLQTLWENAYHAYTNALIDGDRAQVADLWNVMIEIDEDALVMIENIEDYLEREAAA